MPSGKRGRSSSKARARAAAKRLGKPKVAQPAPTARPSKPKAQGATAQPSAKQKRQLNRALTKGNRRQYRSV